MIAVNHIAITVDSSFVLIEHFALLIAYGCCDVGHVFEIDKCLFLYIQFLSA